MDSGGWSTRSLGYQGATAQRRTDGENVYVFLVNFSSRE
ncbi:Beta-galactosidase C-terminal domain [Paenibacillus dokdonensis]